MNSRVCPICGKEFVPTKDQTFCSAQCRGTSSRKLASQKAAEKARELREAKEREYLENPNYCKCCNKELSYKDRLKTFCNSSCAAIYNNSHRRLRKRDVNLTQQGEELYCKYCGKQCKNKNSKAQHEIRCKNNPDRLDPRTYIKPGHSKGHKGSNQYIKARELGLEFPEMSEETRRKIGNGWRGKHHTEEQKKRLSESMKTAVERCPESYSSSNVNGRVKHYEYRGSKMDGSWELEVVKFLDSKNIQWIKPGKGIPYQWEGKTHLYFPDFYLPEYNRYIEVKGYRRDRDLCKWKSVPNLIVLMRKDIEEIKQNKFNLGL